MENETKRNELVASAQDDGIVENLSPGAIRYLVNARLCGGTLVHAKNPVEFYENFLSENYRDKRLAKRMPFLVGELNPAEHLASVSRIIETTCTKYPLPGARLAINRLLWGVEIALLLSNSMVEQTEFDADVLREIHDDLGKELAFLDGERRGAEEEIIALGLQHFPPHVYVAVPKGDER